MNIYVNLLKRDLQQQYGKRKFVFHRNRFICLVQSGSDRFGSDAPAVDIKDLPASVGIYGVADPRKTGQRVTVLFVFYRQNRRGSIFSEYAEDNTFQIAVSWRAENLIPV